MKKKIFAALVVMMGVTMGAVAQTPDPEASAVINSYANVMQAITVTAKQHLNFGNIVANSTKTIALNGDVSGSAVGTTSGDNPTSTGAVGKFLVSAASSTSVKLTFVTTKALAKTDGTPLQTEYTYGWDTAESYNATEATSGTFDESIEVIMPTNVIYVFVGGEVSPTVDQALGHYEGAITLTATYN